MNKKKNITINYEKPIHLFRDELLVIELILKQELVGREFKVAFDNFDSEDVSSIPIDQKLSNGISFHVHSPYFLVEISRFSSSFYVAEDSLQARGATEKIKEIFDKSVHKSVKIRRWVGFCMYGLAMLTVIFLANIEVLKNIIHSSSEIYFMFIALFFLCLVLWWQMMSPLKTIIEFEMRNNRKNFWEKNKEQIYVGLIIGVPVAVVSFVLGLLTGRK